MATTDVLPSYLDNLLMFYTNLGSGGATDAGPPQPPTPDNPKDLFTSIGNWADFCVAPREETIKHPAEPIDNFPDEDHDGYNPYDPHTAEDFATDNRPDDLPMAGLTVDSFFDAANMLTGSYLGRIGEGWTILRDDVKQFMEGSLADSSTSPDEGYGEASFFGAIEDIFSDWKGHAGQAAREYARKLHDAVNDQKRVVSYLTDALTAYIGIVLGARRRMLDLMRAYRDTMRNIEKSTPADNDLAFATGVLATVASSLLSVGAALAAASGTAATGGLGGILALPFANFSISLTSQILAKAQSSVTQAGYAAATVDYLKQAGTVVEDMKKGIDNLVTGAGPDNPMGLLADRRLWGHEPPDPPITRQQFDKDPSSIDKLEPADS